MNENIRSQLFFLKQFGFSEKLLEYIYQSQLNPIETSFNLKNDIFKVTNDNITEKDIELSKQKNEFNRLIYHLLNAEPFLKNKNQNKIFFKYDDNELTKLLSSNIMPIFMYAKGDISLLNLDRKRVAIIGTRSPSEKSTKIAKKITKDYLRNNYVIVSGLAEGIDTISHKAALENEGDTIAILPTNFNKIYPLKNKELAEEISKKGLLLSSIGPNETTYKSNFLKRNKYVANICDLVIVIETNLKSGTMNTLRNANESKTKILFVDQKIKEVNDKIFELGGEMIDS